jgi:predicted NBD/HSP70 family sugar kinase
MIRGVPSADWARRAMWAGVARQVLAHGEMSRPVLARWLAVGPRALEAMLGELPAGGMLVERRGRVALNARFGSVVGVDMGASNLRFALADFTGGVLARAEEKLRPEDGPRKTIHQIQKGIEGLLKSSADLSLRAIAIDVPSPVHPKTRVATFANNLPGWKNIDLRGELERKFRLPVAMENDANMAAIGEHWRGIARGKDHFVFVAVGTGIGSGIFANGRLYEGHTGAAGELFRLQIEWPRWAEEFPETGYFENYVSGMGIAAEGRKALGGSAASTDLIAMRDARFVFAAMRRGNPSARAVLEKIFTMLGVGVANLVAILDPDLIVLGGGIVAGAPEFILSTVRKVVRKIHPNAPPVKLSALGDRAQTAGAIYSALRAACSPDLPESHRPR